MTTRVLALLLLTTAVALGQNNPPAAPVIVEPALDGQILHPGDVHMATEPMLDPDPGDQHLCSEFEIWTVTPPERVWATACLGGIERVHAHIADGTFVGSLTGRSDFDADTDYLLRIRHVDDSGDAQTAAGPFAERPFRTGSGGVILPLELDDIRADPVPRWFGGDGSDIRLPAGAPQPALRIESPHGDLLFAVVGVDGTNNQLLQPGPLEHHEAVRIRLSAGSLAPLSLTPSRIVFTGGDGVERSIHLPAMQVSAGFDRYFWISTNGSSFVGEATQTTPDFSLLAQSATVPWDVRPGFVVEVAASGFKLPVGIAFVPSPGPESDAPLYYVAELHDGIKVVGRDGSVSDFATGLLNFDPLAALPGAGETGIASIAVDPASGNVFASYLYAVPPGAEYPHHPIVVRLSSLDGGRTAVMPPVTVLDMFPEAQGQSHQVSNLSFGEGGLLYVHVGDGFDVQAARDLDYFRGKILRLHPDGTAPIDNPFYNAADGITARDYVFAYGFRNPFGGAWREADGAHYEVENGPTVDRLARVDAGQDYGWAGVDADMTVRAIYNWFYPSAPVNLAWVQPSSFGGSGFPLEMMDRAYVSESGATWSTGPNPFAKRISEFVVDLDGTLVSGPTPLVEYTGVGKASVAALAAGPDGLYFSDLYADLDFSSPIARGANVLRVRFVGSADFSADPVEGEAPLAVQFTDTSTMPGASEWLWSFGDGGSSNEQHPLHIYSATGRYDVRLRVSGPPDVRSLERDHFIRVAATQTDLLVSTTPSRAYPELLDGRTLSSSSAAYVFVDPPERAQQVTFSIDGVYERIEGAPPFDLQGTGGDLSALPLDPAALGEGAHSVTALVELVGGGSEELQASFVVTSVVCGDGIVSGGEACDGGDCCSDACTLAPAGSACSDGLACTHDDTCSDGVCSGVPAICPDTEACEPTACDEAAQGCVVVETPGLPCDDGDACTEDTCADATCGHEPHGFASVDASFGAALAAPHCEDERVPGKLPRALKKARERVSLASEAEEPRRTELLGRAVEMLESAEDRVRRTQRVSAPCTASVEAMLDALTSQLECLAR